jgi:hypothetical protein
VQATAQQGKQAGFTGTVGTGQADFLSGVDLQRSVFEQYADAAHQDKLTKLNHWVNGR